MTRKSLSAALLLLSGVAACWAVWPSQAQAQAVLRNQTRVINQAINNQVRQALRPRLVVRDAAGPVDALTIDGNGRFLAIASRDGGVRVWDLENGRQISRLAAGAVRALAVSRTDRLVVTAGDNGRVTLWDTGGNKEIRRFAGHQGAVLAAALSADGTVLATGGADRTVRLWDVGSGRQTAVIKGHDGPVTAVAFDAAGQTLASGGDDRTIRLWSVPGGQPDKVLAGHEAEVRAMGFGPDGLLYSLGADGTVKGWEGASGQARRSFRALDGSAESLSIRADGAMVVAGGGRAVIVTASGKNIGSVAANVQSSLAVLAPGDNRVLVAAPDGRVLLWDAGANRMAAQLLLTRGGWTVVDASGRYDGSSQGLDDVSWQTDNEVFQMANFAEPYYEPGLLAKTLRAPDQMLTPNASPIDAGIAPPPLVELTVSSGAEVGVPGPAQVTVSAQDRGGKISEILLYQNGKATNPAQIASTQNGTQGGAAVRTVGYNVNLLAGSNHFRAVATGANLIESTPAETTVTVTQKAAAADRPVLHMVTIGINQYASPALTLNYAVNDARGLSDWARRLKGKLFSDVVFHELYDQEATRDAISNLFGQLRQTRPQDVVVIYLAGHGENSEANWYFLPTEFGQGLNFPTATSDSRSITAFRQSVIHAVAQKGLPAAAIEKSLVEIGAQRIVLLIDACKSGGIRKAFDADADRKDLQTLSKQTGIHILAATDNNQYAAEVEELKHGVFTYTILRALAGQADTAPRNGVVSAKELLAYTAEQVPPLAYTKAGGAPQYPTIFSRGVDFDVSPARSR
jgi:hypothetical protein